jgi:hypothetical protein
MKLNKRKVKMIVRNASSISGLGCLLDVLNTVAE